MLEIVRKEGDFGKVEWPSHSNENQLLHLRAKEHGCIFLDAPAYLAGRLMKNWKPSDNKASKAERYTKKESY
jgi:hypothetical protein